jgi:hypothetical protein
VKEGRITLAAGGLIDHAVADLQWQAHTRPRASASPPPAVAEPPPAGDMSYTEARRLQAVAEARMAQMNEAKMARELIRVDAVRDALGHAYATSRDALLQLAARVAPVLAAETDPAAVERVLHAEIHAALVQLAGAGEAVQRAPGAFD